MWFTLPRLVGALAPLPILIACASGGATANVITAPELSRSKAANAYDAIREVRPELLRARESGTLLLFSASRALVAVNDTVAGSIDVLRTIPTDEVARIEYINASKAARSFGPGFGNGIMLVERRAKEQTASRR